MSIALRAMGLEGWPPGHLGFGFQNQRPHAGQGLPAPAPEIADPLVDEPGSRFPGGRWLTAFHSCSTVP
jgi:hypothetical protein